MIQTVVSPAEGLEYSLAAASAVNAGARWLELNVSGAGEAVVADIRDNIIPLCRERGVIVTVRDDAGLAEQLGVHGVHIADKNLNAILMRNRLGAEAIIGIDIADAGAASLMQQNDIDYVRVAASVSDDEARRLVADIRAAGCDIPVVRQVGVDSPEAMRAALDAGFSGIATTDALMTTRDGNGRLRQLFDALP